MVKEFELDPLADIWVVPDMSVYGHVTPRKGAIPAPPPPGDIPGWLKMQSFRLPESTEEYTVTIAASVAQYFLRRDRAVGMLCLLYTSRCV